MSKVVLTPTQRKVLEKLWFVYGNSGAKATKGNHGFIQGFLEAGEDRRVFYIKGLDALKAKGVNLKVWGITSECIAEVDKVLGNPVSKDPLEISGQRYWWYHPESDSYVTFTRDEMSVCADAGLLEELGPATTEDQAEAKRLHQEAINEFRKRV